jgi:hypothetical protein
MTSVLEGFEPEKKFAVDNEISDRTIKNYRKLPDGLPYVMWGGRVYIPIEKARAWLERRINHPNQRRGAK